MKNFTNAFKAASILTVFLLILGVLHYFWAKRNIYIAKTYASVQTVLLMIFSIELNVLIGSAFEEQDGWCIIIALMTLLSFFICSKSQQILVYVVCLIYNGARTYFWVVTFGRYIRYNAYMALTFIVVYLFSRMFHQSVREKFIKIKNQHQLLRLFNKLMKAYHEGIILSSNSDIILFNKQTSKIFDFHGRDK